MKTRAFNIRAGKRMLDLILLFWGGLKTDAGWIRGELQQRSPIKALVVQAASIGVNHEATKREI